MADALALEVRQAREEERAAMRELLHEAPEAATWVDTYPAVVGVVGEKLIGFLLYRVVAGEGEILNLAVRQDARRKGCASALFAAIKSEAQEWHLEVRETNRAAQDLYGRWGFRCVGRRERYYADGEAALLWRLEV